MTDPVKAWYFARKGNRLGFGDNRIVRVGITHTTDRKPVLCEHGFHGSTRVIDALLYASYHILYRVVLSGEMDIGGDKIAAQARQYLQRFDMKDILREFARKQALINIHKIKPYTPKADYASIVRWLETGDESVRSLAWSVGFPAAREAPVKSAVWASVWASTEAAARSAESVAWAAGLAVREEAREAQNEMLLEMITDKYGAIQ